jgi:hypothetical protein
MTMPRYTSTHYHIAGILNTQLNNMTAWGVLIEDELDQRRVFWILAAPMLIISMVITRVWSICTGSRAEGLNAVAFVATILGVFTLSL